MTGIFGENGLGGTSAYAMGTRDVAPVPTGVPRKYTRLPLAIICTGTKPRPASGTCTGAGFCGSSAENATTPLVVPTNTNGYTAAKQRPRLPPQPMPSPTGNCVARYL